MICCRTIPLLQILILWGRDRVLPVFHWNWLFGSKPCRKSVPHDMMFTDCKASLLVPVVCIQFSANHQARLIGPSGNGPEQQWLTCIISDLISPRFYILVYLYKPVMWFHMHGSLNLSRLVKKKLPLMNAVSCDKRHTSLQSLCNPDTHYYFTFMLDAL